MKNSTIETIVNKSSDSQISRAIRESFKTVHSIQNAIHLIEDYKNTGKELSKETLEVYNTLLIARKEIENALSRLNEDSL